MPDPFRLQSPISYEVSILRNLLLILLVVVAVSCDDMQKPVMNVITEPVATEEPVSPVETQYPTITFDNAFDITPGVYRFRPNTYTSGTDDFGDGVVTSLAWGSVVYGDSIAGLPPDTPKISVTIFLDPEPYEKMGNGELAINFERFPDETVVVDELLVEIKEKRWEWTEEGGGRGNKFEYEVVGYWGVAKENLTNPDRVFEYE